MTYQDTIHGGFTNTDGSCPGCGASVPRKHAWSTGQAKEAYECPQCGVFEYATDGVELPVRADPIRVDTRIGFTDQSATVRSVLDRGDCVS